MNKTEKLISILLGIALVFCLMNGRSLKQSDDAAPAADGSVASTNEVAAAESVASTNAVLAEVMAQADSVAASASDSLPTASHMPPPSVPEKTVVLENDCLKLELSTWGAVVKRATLKKYAQGLGELSEENPPVVMDYSTSPLGELKSVPGLAQNAAYEAVVEGSVATFTAPGVTRTYTLDENYRLTLKETFAEGSRPAGRNSLGIGMMTRGDGPTDVVSVDSWQYGAKGGEVLHHDDDDTPVKGIIGSGIAGGCTGGGCTPQTVAPGAPEFNSAACLGPQKWIALKDRFFVTALVGSDQPNVGFSADVRRDMATNVYRPLSVAGEVLFEGGVAERSSEFFIGPKKQSYLWDRGMKDVMEFGMWRWICYPVVWLLNLCYAAIPSYGIAIIILTILVRLVFWPLTRKSTEGMKKMQEIQPLLKEIQAKYKDNPQRMQQETFALYREKKVNPLSSCLPMLIQIPVFIALFNVLRSAVELRYAGFLWISDLSEPEHLFASWFPFGGLNILPILMAATMFLQSKLTPSMGDAKQQRMMTVFMPVMMLFMFYNFASALSLYWTLSQVMSIVQMWMIRRATEQKRRVLEPEVIDPPAPTRQQRRHGKGAGES